MHIVDCPAAKVIAMPGKADWLGWSIQAVVGFILGAILGFALMCKGRYGNWLVDAAVVPHFILGIGLLAAGLASHYGDQLWMDYKVIPIDGPTQSRLSVSLSLLLGVAGVALMAHAILRTFGIV